MSKHGSDHYVLFFHDRLSRLDIMQLSFSPPWVDPWDTPGKPTGTKGRMVQFSSSFFLAGDRSCLVLDMTSLDHGNIPMGFVRGSVTGKCFTWHYGRCEKISKKRAKNLDTPTCYYCQ